MWRGRQVNTITLEEALNRIRLGQARPIHKKRRLVAIDKLYFEAGQANVGGGSLIGQKFTYRHETPNNPPNVIALKKIHRKTGAFVAA